MGRLLQPVFCGAQQRRCPEPSSVSAGGSAEIDWRAHRAPMDLGTSLGRSSDAALERVSALDWRFLRRFVDRLVPIGFGLADGADEP